MNFTQYCPKCGEKLIYYVNDKYCLNCSYKLSQVCHSCNDEQRELILDISFKSKGLAKALSNLCNYPFVKDGVSCESMESFIQSLRVKDPSLQKEIYSKTGPFAYSIREVLPDWRINKTVYWQGIAINRLSPSYFEFMKSAYKCLYTSSAIFRCALAQSSQLILIHSSGCNEISETLLTPSEYISLLQYLIKTYGLNR